MNFRILIVEDEPKLCDILCDYYRSKGDLPTKATNGIEALEIAESQDFDAVLLDIMMPGLDGFAIAKSIIDLHGGNCMVKNTSTGVEFSFTI